MDYSKLTDEQLAAELAATTRLPPIMRRHDARALQSEIDRRRYAADNVARNLDAASTPLTPDPTVRPRVVVPPAQSPRDSYRRGLVAAGWEPDEVDRIMASEAGMPGAFQVPYSTDSELEAAADRERQYASDWHAREGQHAATEQYWRDVYGHNDQPEMSTTFARDGRGSAYAALTDFGGGQSEMVDGYSVPVFDIGDGRQRYRLGDLKRAQEAEAEARRVASVRALVDSDNAQYGHYSMRDDSPLLTPDQTAARAARAAAEKNEQNTDRAKFLRAQRERDRAMMPSEGERRRRRADMARLAGGSQNLHSGNNAMFQALAMMEGVDPSKMNAQQQAMMQMMPMDRNRAAVEAQQTELLNQFGLRFAQGQGFQQGNPMEIATLQRMNTLRSRAGEAATKAGRGLERREADRALIAAGASAEERFAILTDLFGNMGGMQPPFEEPLPLPEGHGNPGRMPDGTYPMM